MTGRGGSQDRAGSGGQSPKLLPDGGTHADDSSGFEPFECELDWTYTVHLENGPVKVRLQKQVTGTDVPNIDYLVGALRFEGDIPDSRAQWHHNYTPIDRWIRAHIFREARDFYIQEVAKYLNKTPSTALWMGFWDEPSVRTENADPPKYTQLRDMWEEKFSARMRGAVQVIAQRLVEYARDNGLPAPEKVFLPKDNVEPDEAGEDNPDDSGTHH